MTEPNNTLATATFVGALGFTPTSIFDFVGSADTQDYWRFTLSGTSDINIGLTGLTADADVQLLNSAGTVIGSSTRGGTNSEDIHFNARPAGTYYVRVFQFSGNTNYNLRLSTADPSNILAPQENLGNIGNTAVIRAGSINSNNSSDFYRFSVASLANVNAQLTGLSADADLRVIQDVNNSGTVDAGDVTVASTTGGSAAENLNITALAGGNYFAQVYQFGTSTTNYSLRLITEDNSLASATNIGTLTTAPVSFSNFVGATDTQDYWRFTLSGTSDINIGLTGLTADADVQLLNSAGTVIGSSTRGGTNSEDIHFNARPAGTYYARVFQFSGDTNYNLRLSTADPSNILAPQENLGNIGNTAVFRAGSINSDNSSDFYGFSVASLANVNAQLTGLSADADLRVIQDVNNSGTVDAGDVTVASTTGGSAAENLNITALAGGNYFAQVYQFGTSTTNYSLRLITEDNSLASANNIGALTATPVSFSNFVGATDTQDYWRFTLSGTSDINIGLTGLTADADVQLLNSAGTVIGSSTRGGTNSEDIHFNARPAGTYYARVFRFSGDTNYNLRLSTADPSNILAPQENLGPLVGSVNRSDFVGSDDTSDFYRFSVFGTRTLTAVVNGLSSDADLRLIRDINSDGILQAGEIVASSTLGGTSSESINRVLGSGDYYLQVYQFSGNTNYNLGVTVI